MSQPTPSRPVVTVRSRLPEVIVMATLGGGAIAALGASASGCSSPSNPDAGPCGSEECFPVPTDDGGMYLPDGGLMCECV